MNKKGAQVFLTRGMVFAIMAFIIFVLFMLGGGASTTFRLGEFVSKIPLWFWIVVALFWLSRGGRRR